ncbi:MAG: response regulator transcription factor [Clostridiales bacterium]|jgi:DNA-binding response OmpR family regulator|nr:response regulator transcription factor [Clostridiales bacterium]
MTKQVIKTVLAVDDEPNILEPVKAYLEKLGYNVLTTERGQDALSLADKADIILLDLMLPDISGEDVCRKIRETSNVPIIMLTAKVAESSQFDGLSMGADDYVTKPFSLKLLAARIEAVLRRLPESEPPELFADKQFTATERKIVNALSRRPSRVFTRDELISVAFDDEFDGYDRVIDTHIKNLRKKIGGNCIITVHGLGYKWGGAN